MNRKQLSSTNIVDSMTRTAGFLFSPLRILALAAIFVAQTASATIVQFETAMGNFEVNLYDDTTPLTVANFLEYVNDGDFASSIVHRSVDGFVVQGGGFSYSGEWPVSAISTNPSVANEPVYSNVRGTIAMAKLAGDPDSATFQWFINLGNNAANLDAQNGGFTVFGQITGDGMAVINQIAALPIADFSAQVGALGSLPVQNFTAGSTPDETNLVIINSITVLDSIADTASGLSRPLTTRQEEAAAPASSGGGTFGGLLLPFILLLGLRNKRS